MGIGTHRKRSLFFRELYLTEGGGKKGGNRGKGDDGPFRGEGGGFQGPGRGTTDYSQSHLKRGKLPEKEVAFWGMKHS